MDMCGTHVENKTMTVSCYVMIYNIYICIHMYTYYYCVYIYIHICIDTHYSQLTEWLGVFACVSSIRMWLDNAAFGFVATETQRNTSFSLLPSGK